MTDSTITSGVMLCVACVCVGVLETLTVFKECVLGIFRLQKDAGDS